MLLSNPPLWQLIRPQIIFLLDSGFAPELIASYGFDIAIVLACGQALASAGTTLSPMEQEASQRLRGQPMVPLTQNVPQPFTQQTAAPAAAPSSRRNLPPSPLRMRIEELATSDDETHASRQRAQPIPPVIEEPRTEEQSAPEEDSLLVEAIEEDELETSDGDEINELMMATDEQKVSGQELRIGDAEDDASGAFEFVSAIAAQEEDVTASSMLPSADSILEETGLSSVEVTLPNIQAPVPEVPPLRTMADSLTGFTLEKKIASLSSIRSRVQASDLNSYAAPVKGGSRPGSADSSLNSTNNLKRFIQERPLSYVIDLSDSDSSDSNNSEPDLSSSTKKDSTKKQKLDALQSEISKLNELIASKAKLKKAQSAETLNVLPVKHARQHSGPSALEKVQLSISRDTSMEPAPAFQSKSISPTKRQTSPLRRPHFPSKTSTPKSPERRSLSLQKPVFVPQATLRRSASPVKRAVALEPTKSTTETPSPQKMADNLLKSMSVTSSPVKVPSQPQWMSPPEDTSMTDVSAESRVTAEKDKDMTSVAQQASSNASPPVKNSTHQIEQQATVPTKRKFQKPSDLKHTPASLLDHKLKIATLETAINQITSSMDQGKTELDSVSEKLSALKASSLENHTIVQKLTKENLRLEQEIREREKQKQKNLELSKSAIATAETLKAEEKRLMNLLLTLKTNVESGKMSLDALRAECALLQSQTGSQGVESSFVPSPEPQKPKRVMVQSPAKAKTSAPAAVQSPPVKLDFLDHLLKLLADAQVKLSVADSLETPDPSSVFQEEPTVTPLIVLNDVLVSEQDLSWPSDHLHHIEDYMDARNANKKQAQTTEPNFTASVETTPKSPVKPSFKPYTSVLGGYRSLRQTETSDNGSLTYENNLDPTRNLCKFEMDGGECLDPGCAGQHFRDLNCSGKRFLMLFEYGLKHNYTEEEMIKKMIERVYRLCSIEQLIDLTQQLEGSRDKLAKPKEIIQFIYSFERGNSLRSSPHSVFLETDKVSTKNDTPERPKVDLNPETAFKAPLSFPIKIEGLQKLVLGDDTSVTRYYDSPPTAETFEEMVKKTPTNTAAWLNYAIFMLPSDLSYETLEKKSTNVHKTLNILSRALRLNRFSYQLWYLYMEIYSRRGKEEDIRRLFKQALSFIPNDLELWWRFYTWETTFVAKREILDQMLIELTRNHLLTTMGGSRSLMILSVVVQYVKLSLDYEDSESAGTRFDCILSSKTADDIVSAVIPEAFRPINETFLFKNMSRKHVALAWLLRCHISYFGHLPHQAFLRSPYNYTIRDDLFLINWCAANVVLDVALFVGGTLTFIAGSFEGIADEPDTKHAYIAVARNLFTFQRDVMKKPNIVIRQSSAVAAAKYAEFPEMWLIDASFSDVCVIFV